MNAPRSSRADAPFVGVHIIGAVAQVVDESQGQALESHDDIAARCIGRQDDGFAAQVAQSGFEVKFLAGKGLGRAGRGEGEGG